MAYQELYRFTIQNAAGDYYIATLNTDASWTVSTLPTLTYIEVLPDGWNDTQIEWQRDMQYMGVFRSQTNSPYKWSMDGKAIVDYIRSIGGIQGYGLLSIYIANGFDYVLYYQSEMDFKTYKQNKLAELSEVGLLDSRAVNDLHAFGDTKYNIPIWKNTGTTISPVWELNDSEWIWHEGIKLLYSASFTSSANYSEYPRNLAYYTVSAVVFAGEVIAPASQQLNGWNRGAQGDGYHIIPALSPFNITQNNGATTFIGNDILSPFLLQGSQCPGAANYASEAPFSGVNHTQAFTRNNYTLKNLQDNVDGGQANMTVSCRIAFDTGFPNPLLPYPLDRGGITEIGSGGGKYFSVVLFEINSDDKPTIVSSRFVAPIEILRIPLTPDGFGRCPTISGIVPSTGAAISAIAGVPGYNSYLFDTTDFPVSFTLNYGKVYLPGYICDTSAGLGSAMSCSFALSQFEVTFGSYVWKVGDAGIPADVLAPRLNASASAGFRINTLVGKIVNNLASRQSDSYGFPVPIASDYTFTSNYLSNPLLTPVKDIVPYQIMITSAYCIHDLAGQSYVTSSFNEQFDFCKKQLGMALGLIGNAFVMENLRYFFDSATMILDLGYDVTDFEIIQDISGVGSNLILGYQKAETNNDFGVDPINSGLVFSTPATNTPSDMNYAETSIMTEMYAIEKMRAQHTSQPIGSTIDPQGTSDSNSTIAIYCEPSIGIPRTVVDPSNNIVSYQAYKPQTFATAQETDITAATAPYMQGWYYPDTAINVPLSPCRALYRDTGAQIHSVLDKMDADYLVFRNTYVMQYNNTTLGLPGFSSKLDVGTGTAAVVEHEDKLISTLPTKLYLPVLCKVKSTSTRNLYNILNTNPNGYIRFFWREPGFGYREYKFFMNVATMTATPEGNIVSEFIGPFTPDMVI